MSDISVEQARTQLLTQEFSQQIGELTRRLADARLEVLLEQQVSASLRARLEQAKESSKGEESSDTP